MRKRWIEAGQPMREDWLEILEDAKREGNINVTNSRQQIFDSNKAKGLLGRRVTNLLPCVSAVIDAAHHSATVTQ